MFSLTAVLDVSRYCHDSCIINDAKGEASDYEIINSFLYYARHDYYRCIDCNDCACSDM